jgi:hypothetical protein
MACWVEARPHLAAFLTTAREPKVFAACSSPLLGFARLADGPLRMSAAGRHNMRCTARKLE